jgi:hypothetical protein
MDLSPECFRNLLHSPSIQDLLIELNSCPDVIIIYNNPNQDIKLCAREHVKSSYMQRQKEQQWEDHLHAKDPTHGLDPEPSNRSFP